ncbi:hypothetical protein ACFFR3_46270 [Nonomuraea salmonea]|uniref:Cation-transporting P-type ATPase N-terminal domain-containing protein n=1 Tax=Nonomuraea salmonea TaxID=46181 RepID=A0ABV5P2Z7_9ACTN
MCDVAALKDRISALKGEYEGQDLSDAQIAEASRVFGPEVIPSLSEDPDVT